MAGDWRITNLADVCARVSVGYVGPTSEYFCESSEGVRILRSQNVRPGRMELKDVKYVRTEFHSKNKKSQLKAGDILFVRVGQNRGDCCIVPENVGELNCANIVFARPSRALSAFLGFYFRSPIGQQQLRSISTGSAQGVLNTGAIASLKVPVPPDDEAQAIAAVLGALDDKIELNRRMNATLEAMARTLFQSWFVDFDPVRAKLDGQEPFGLDPDTAALFPDAFQDSELGRIPNGWALGRVVDASDFSRSSISPGGFPDETFDHYSLPAFDEGRTPKAEFGGAIMSNKLVVTRDSILLSKLNPHIPRIWLPDLHATRRSVCSTEFIVATPRVGYSREFLFSLFTSAAFASSYCMLVTGTTGSHQRIRPESVLDMNTVIPPPQLVEVFTAVAKPMFDQINRNIDQSRILASLSDTLLPRLLSGELSIN